MILDEDRNKIYFKDKEINLNYYQNRLMLYLIKNKNNTCALRDITKFVYEKKIENNVSKYYPSIRRLIQKINIKIQPYAKILPQKQYKGYFLEIENFDLKFKQNFIREHRDKVLLLELNNLKKQINSIEKFLI
jgi:DNA-binding response OmpR family regulator